MSLGEKAQLSPFEKLSTAGISVPLVTLAAEESATSVLCSTLWRMSEEYLPRVYFVAPLCLIGVSTIFVIWWIGAKMVTTKALEACDGTMHLRNLLHSFLLLQPVSFSFCPGALRFSVPAW